jgi:hypothetical protein
LYSLIFLLIRLEKYLILDLLYFYSILWVKTSIRTIILCLFLHFPTFFGLFAYSLYTSKIVQYPMVSVNKNRPSTKNQCVYYFLDNFLYQTHLKNRVYPCQKMVPSPTFWAIFHFVPDQKIVSIHAKMPKSVPSPTFLVHFPCQFWSKTIF